MNLKQNAQQENVVSFGARSLCAPPATVQKKLCEKSIVPLHVQKTQKTKLFWQFKNYSQMSTYLKKCLHEKVAPIHKFSNGIAYLIFRQMV